uniref:Uncharacterized protein n=1 Tax=Leersia perrieri TaxID=77586 RepID=A0A0D9VPS1_9ORYZ
MLSFPPRRACSLASLPLAAHATITSTTPQYQQHRLHQLPCALARTPVIGRGSKGGHAGAEPHAAAADREDQSCRSRTHAAAGIDAEDEPYADINTNNDARTSLLGVPRPAAARGFFKSFINHHHPQGYFSMHQGFSLDEFHEFQIISNSFLKK